MRINTNDLAMLQHFAKSGDKMAKAMLGVFSSFRDVDLSAGAEGTPVANTIRVTGSVNDLDGKPVPGVKGLMIKLMSPGGAFSVSVSTGTSKHNDGDFVWVETNADGKFVFDVLDTDEGGEDLLVIVTLDDGTSSFIKLTYAP